MTDLTGLLFPPAALGQIGDFRLLREVSRGAWRGWSHLRSHAALALGQRVALKTLPVAAALDPRHLERFRVEAQAAASLCHPNIVPVFATGATEGIPWLAGRGSSTGVTLPCVIHSGGVTSPVSPRYRAPGILRRRCG